MANLDPMIHPSYEWVREKFPGVDFDSAERVNFDPTYCDIARALLALRARHRALLAWAREARVWLPYVSSTACREVYDAAPTEVTEERDNDPA